jgi:hypothetical protein
MLLPFSRGTGAAASLLCNEQGRRKETTSTKLRAFFPDAHDERNRCTFSLLA